MIEGGRQRLTLHGLEAAVEERLRAWQAADVAGRLWRKDPTLWGDEETPELTDRLGWLDLPDVMETEADQMTTFAEEVRAEDIRDIVLLGMGGSSLAAEVFAEVFGSAAGCPTLRVLDSTHPAAIRAVEKDIDLHRTLFVVASKSGTTTETLSFFRYFWDRMAAAVDRPSRHFAAITDPGTPLAALAEERGFRRLFLAPPDLGGRYSALSPFGLVPAALVGADLHAILRRAQEAAAAAHADASANAALRLGAALAEAGQTGRDKITLAASPSLKAFPAWLEQLLAESTGKEGQGLIPVTGEPLVAPDAYGADRFFVYFHLTGDEDGVQEDVLVALEDAGHLVARFELADRADVAREMFRWEVAVAATGAAMDIHPFNQPNVEAAKRLARGAMQSDGGVRAEDVKTTAAAEIDALGAALAEWLTPAQAGDYVAVQAYLAPSPRVTGALRRLTTALRTRTGLAATLGYGPRFLHSTGQLHKGGPDTGLFLQLVDTPAEDLPVPETDHTFARLLKAQVLGDYRALHEQDRRVLRVLLGRDAWEELAVLERVVRGE